MLSKLSSKQLDLAKDLFFTGGNIQLASGRILVGDGDQTTPSISFTSDPSTGLFLSSPGEIAISAGANAYVYLKDDGTVEMTGTTGIAIQAGTTADRPSDPLDGIMRYNLDNDTHETFVDNEWTEFVLSDDLRLSDHNILKVRKSPGKDQFATISAAIGAVANPSLTNRFLIDVGPGIFIEPTMVLPSYVHLRGASGATVVQADGPNKHLFQINTWTSISNIRATGVSGANYAAFYAHSSNTASTGSAMLRDITFGANNTQVLVQQDAGTTLTVFSEGGHIGAYGSFDQGFIAIGPGAARINVRSLTTNGTTAPAPSTFFKADGPLTTVLSAGSLYRNSVGNAGIGIHLRNGGTGRFVGVSLLGFAKAIWCENNGTGPVFNGDSINLQSNTQDLVIEHPGTTGHFLGCAERSKVLVDSASTMTVFYSDPTSTGITSVGPLYLGPSHAKTTEMSEMFGKTTTMGILNGGKLTVGTGYVLNIAAGSGYCTIDDPVHRPVKIYWNNTTLTLPPNSANFIYYTNTGVLSRAASIPSLSENIVLGRVVTNGSEIAWIEEIPSNAVHLGNNLETMLRESFGPVYSGGSIVTEGTIPRTINVTAGSYYFGSIRIAPSGGSAVSMRQFSHSSGAWTYSDSTSISNTMYDNGTNLTALTPGYYARHSLYVTGEGINERYIMLYAQAQYSSLVTVESAALPTPPSLIDESVTLIASIIVRQGTNNIISIYDHRPVLGFAGAKLSAASDHGNLLGLDDDDHPQYFLTNGVRAFAGTLNMSGNPITNAGLINDVSITSHGSRHLPNGADPLTTSAAVGLSLSTTNTVGTANALARADHTHVITGVQPVNAHLTSIAATATNGLIARTAAGTTTPRTIAGTAGRTTVINGDGVSGNPTVDLVSGIANPGSYSRVTVDTYGRVTVGNLSFATYYATRFDSPMTTGSWPIKAQAAAYLDPSHPSMTVRGFDDTIPEGVGISADVPPNAVSCNITLVGRARSGPAAAQSALWNVYFHSYPIGVLAPDWGSAIALNPITVAQGNIFLYAVTTNVTVAAMGLTAGSPFQMEIVRNANAAGDTLVGDFALFYAKLDWQAV